MLEETLKAPCAKKAVQDKNELQDLLNRIDQEGGINHEPAKAPASKTSKLLDAAYEIGINGMLSSVTTQTKNIVANSTVLPLRLMETAAAAGISKVVPGADISLKEAIAEGAGMAEGIGDAFIFLADRLSSLDSNASLLEGMGLPTRLAEQTKLAEVRQAITGANIDNFILKHALNWFGAYVNLPGKALSTADTFFKIIHYRSEVSKQAMRKALESDSPTDISRIAEKLKQQALDSPGSELMKLGIQDAEYRTFTSQPQGIINQAMAKYGHIWPGVRWVVPFRRTMVNVINYGIERSPLAVTQSKTRQALAAGGNERAEALGRMSVGTALIIGSAYFLGGRLSGEGPKDPQLQYAARQNGFRPNTLQIGSLHIPFDMLGPLGLFLRTQAKYQEAVSNISFFHDDEPERTILQLGGEYVLALAESLYEDYWAKSLADGFAAVVQVMRMPHDKPTEEKIKPLLTYVSKLTQNVFGPSNLIKDEVTRRLDPEIKDITSPLESYLARVPILSKSVEPKISLYGNPMHYDHYLDPDLADPVDEKDPQVQEMRKVGVTINKPRRVYKGVRLTNKEYTQFLIYAGKGGQLNGQRILSMREAIDTVINSSIYKKYPNMRAGLIEDTINAQREAGKALLMNDPRFDLANRVMQAEQELQKKMLRTK